MASSFFGAAGGFFPGSEVVMFNDRVSIVRSKATPQTECLVFDFSQRTVVSGADTFILSDVAELKKKSIFPEWIICLFGGKAAVSPDFIQNAVAGKHTDLPAAKVVCVSNFGTSREFSEGIAIGLVPSQLTIANFWNTISQWRSPKLPTSSVASELISEQVGSVPQAVPEAPAEVRNSQGNVSLRRKLRIGSVLDRYKLVKHLGSGQSADVWQATVLEPPDGVGLTSGQVVAIKVYDERLIFGSQTIRIQREYSVLNDLDHPSLAKVYDLVLSPSRPFHHFMVMEFVAGKTLKDEIAKVGPVGNIQLAIIAKQLFGAILAIHDARAIHRDVKAANIIVTKGGAAPEIKLLDLGIVVSHDDERLTEMSTFMGSKHYASFEQLTGRAVTEASDIYSAGSVLFHAVTGRSMYEGAGPLGAIVARMMEKPEILEEPITGYSEPMIRFINSCIAFRAEDRPESAEKCLQEINKILMSDSAGVAGAR